MRRTFAIEPPSVDPIRADRRRSLDPGHVAPFAAVIVVAFALVPVAGDHVDATRLAVAGAVTAFTVLLGYALPLLRAPRWSTGVIPLLFLVVIAALRDPNHGFDNGYGSLVAIPILWCALHGSRRQLVLVVIGVAGVLALPPLLDSTAGIPAPELRRTVLWITIAGVLGSEVQRVVASLERSRRELRASEERSRTLVERLPELVIVEFDEDLRFLSIQGSGFGGEGGRPWAELVGLRPADLWEPDRAAEFASAMRLALDGEDSSFEWLALDGVRTHQIAVTAWPQRAGDPVRGLIVARDITAAKQLERRLAESERRHRATLDDLREVVFRTSVDGTIEYVNLAWVGAIGTPLRAAIGSSLLDHVHEQDRGPVAELLALAGRGASGSLDEELRFTIAGGGERWFRINARAVTESHVSSAGITGTLLDVTARREAEQRQRSLSTVLSRANDAVISVALDGSITGWSAGAERLFGWTEQEMVGRPLELLTPPGFAEERDRNMTETSQFGQTVDMETRRLHRDGSLVDVAMTVFPVVGPSGDVESMAGILRDIRPRIRRERLARARAAVTREIARDEPRDVTLERIELDLMLVLEARGARVTLGATDEGTREDTGTMRVVIPGVDGPIGSVLLDRGNDGQPKDALRAALVDIAREIGDYAERLRVRADAERVKDQFFALVSHELRTPLASVIGYLELITEEESEAMSEDGRRFLAVMQRNAERLHRLVDDLLLAAQIEAGTLTVVAGEVRPRELVAQALDAARPVADDRDLQLQAELADDLPDTFVGDPVRLAQVLDNLLVNALKFTPPGGQVTVAAASPRPGWVQLQVRDTGPGVEEAERERLFSRFARARRVEADHVPGVGLGLAIVHAIVEAHHGTIEVSDTPGGGATFTVELPTSGASGPSASPAASQPEA